MKRRAAAEPKCHDSKRLGRKQTRGGFQPPTQTGCFTEAIRKKPLADDAAMQGRPLLNPRFANGHAAGADGHAWRSGKFPRASSGTIANHRPGAANGADADCAHDPDGVFARSPGSAGMRAAICGAFRREYAGHDLCHAGSMQRGRLGRGSVGDQR